MLRRWRRRLPGLLFWLCLAVAAVLLALVLVAPSLDRQTEPAASTPRRLLRLFAQDSTVRQTSVASALGLIVTAFAFFRGPFSRPPRAPSDVVGA